MENTALSRGRESHLSVGFIRATVKIMENVGFEKVRGTECLYRYRPNGKYYARFAVNGKEVRRSLRTTDRDLAKRELARVQRYEEIVDPAAGNVTLAALCDRYLATVAYQADKTISQKAYICRSIKGQWPGGANVRIHKIVSSHVQSFLSRYDFGASSYNAYLAVLR